MTHAGFDGIIKSCLADRGARGEKKGILLKDVMIKNDVFVISYSSGEACGTGSGVGDINAAVRGGCVSRALLKGVISFVHPEERRLSAALKKKKKKTWSNHCPLARNGNAETWQEHSTKTRELHTERLQANLLWMFRVKLNVWGFIEWQSG